MDYSNAKTGTNEYVSAALCDASGNILYYGNIATNSASGTAQINIPTGIAAGSYKLNIFSEQCNGDKKSDYASEFKTIDLTVRAKYTDATLSGLTLSQGILSPTFISETTSYTASVASDVASITVTPTVHESHATVTVNGTAVTSGSASGAVTLNKGSNTINVVVTAEDGSTTKTYTVVLTKSRSSYTNDSDNHSR